MSSDRTASIIAPAGGRKNFVALNVPLGHLTTYSVVAKHHYSPTTGFREPVGSTIMRRVSSTHTEFDLGEGMDEDHARTIAAFIKASNPADPKHITLALFGNNLTVSELVKVWRIIGHGFKVPRELHDESIRDDLRLKMYSTTPYSAADFKLVTENLDLDCGLVHSAVDRVAFLHVKKYLDDKAKQEVEELLGLLLETVGRVEAKINKAAKQKAIREQHQQQQDKQSPKNKQRAPKITKAPKNKEPSSSGKNNTPCEGLKGQGRTDGAKFSGGGKSKDSKGKGKQAPKPFVRKDEDFPPLARTRTSHRSLEKWPGVHQALTALKTLGCSKGN